MTEHARAIPDPPPDPWALDEPVGPPVDPALGGPLRVRVPGGPGSADTGSAGAGARTAGMDSAATAGGVVVVATDALQAHLERLELLSADLAGDAYALASLPALPPAAPDPVSGLAPASVPFLLAARDQAPSRETVRAAERLADRARTALRIAIARYSEVESEQRARMLALGQGVASALGPMLRTIVLFGLPAVLAARATGLLGNEQLAAVRRWLIEHPELITSPAFVEAVRAGAMGADEAVSTALGAPPETIAGIAGAQGFEGVQAGGIALLGIATPLGLFRDGPVRVDRVSTLPLLDGPAGASGRLARVPEGDQVRIERYDAPDAPPRFVVYVGPTETFSPVASDEPWDLTSNVTGVTGLSAGSLRATEAAMRDAGITSTDQVQFVGFSQGGLVAARLAASGDWNAAGLETYGAPTGNVALPEGLTGMAVRNSDDFIPALAGPQLDDRLLQVERQAFAPGSPIPDAVAAPAHQRSAYVATAAAVDAAQSAAVREQIAAMDAFTADYTAEDGSRATVTVYRAERGAERALSAGGSSR
ncbi:MAG: hypothetical protein KF727_08970 [Microbacteriaceae bacterium]|nr:hypothetical protein [Microbacteriaceae bacterium]